MNEYQQIQPKSLGCSLAADKYPHLKNCTGEFVVNNGEVTLGINIDSVHHRYLQDHVFGGDSFVPATMIMELLFEAALYYCESYLKLDIIDLKPARLMDFSILRAMAMQPGNSLGAQFVFKQVNENDDEIYMDIEIISKRVSKSGTVLGKRLNASSKVILSYNALKKTEFKIPDDYYDYYQVPKELFYKNYFPSLGYFFQSSCAKFAVSRDKTCFIGEYDCMNKEKDFILHQVSTFVTSPLGNDSCLQYTVFFSRVINLIGRLPIGGEKLEFYRRHPLQGKVKVFVECITIDDDMVCNIYSFDNEGLIFYAKKFVVRKSPYHKLIERNEFDSIINEYRTEPFNL